MNPVKSLVGLVAPLGRLRSLRTPPPMEHEIAIAHDYLTQRGGAERVVLALHRIFPEAPIYTTLYDPEATFPEFAGATVITSPLNRIGLLRRHHRAALPLLPLAATLLKVPARLTIASSTGWSHGFAAAGRSLVYCHSPARWLYLSEQYLGDRGRRNLTARILSALKPPLIAWDQWAARRRDQPYLSNSTAVRERIRAVYGIDAPVVFPPHAVDAAAETAPIPEVPWGPGEYFLTVSRLLPYKNVHHVVEAFRGLDQHLVVIGAGPLAKQLREAAPQNVVIVSDVAEAQMRWAYRGARAVISVSYEDFGISPLEGASYGRPTIALQAGGFLDTIREGITGTFVQEPTPEAVRTAVLAFREEDFDVATIRDHARHFGQERFERQLRGQLVALGLLPPDRL